MTMVELEKKAVKGKQRNLGRMAKYRCRYDRTSAVGLFADKRG